MRIRWDVAIRVWAFWGGTFALARKVLNLGTIGKPAKVNDIFYISKDCVAKAAWPRLLADPMYTIFFGLTIGLQLHFKSRLAPPLLEYPRMEKILAALISISIFFCRYWWMLKFSGDEHSLQIWLYQYNRIFSLRRRIWNDRNNRLKHFLVSSILSNRFYKM